MRIAACALSAVLLSGCSWLGLGGSTGSSDAQHASSGRYNASAQGLHAGQMPQGYASATRKNPCEISSASHPIPTGCNPAQVTIAMPSEAYGGASQGYATPSYKAQTPDYSSYGRSVNHTSQAVSAANSGIHKVWERPRLRLNGSLGFETSVSGELMNPDVLGTFYDPAVHAEGFVTGSQASGQIVETIYYVPNPLSGALVPGGTVTGEVFTKAPTISVSDAYAAPFTASLGAEYQLDNNFSVFAQGSHSAAQGGKAGGATYEGDVTQYQRIEEYEEITDPVTGDVTGYNLVGTVDGNTSFKNVNVAYTDVEVSDLKRSSFELGGRYYFGDAFTDKLERPLAPYISASAGAAHYSAFEAKQTLNQLFLDDYYSNATVAGGETNYYLDQRGTPVEILKKGWVPTGAINIGAEWQVTPKAALAFETGVKYEGGREYGDTLGIDSKTDGNISIPLTLRGSIGF